MQVLVYPRPFPYNYLYLDLWPSTLQGMSLGIDTATAMATGIEVVSRSQTLWLHETTFKVRKPLN